MVRRCCALNCPNRADKASQRTENVTFHSFPSDLEFRAKWIRKLCPQGYQPHTYSKVCSMHFSEKDFQETRTDSNPRRARKLSRLRKLRRLKPNAVPRFFFEDLPTPPDIGIAVDANLDDKEMVLLEPEFREDGRENFKNDGGILDFDDIGIWLRSESTFEDLSLCKKDDFISISFMDFDKSRTAFLNACIVIERSLDVTITYNGKIVDGERFLEHGNNNFQKLQTFSQLSNLIKTVREWIREESNSPLVDTASNCLEKFSNSLEGVGDDEDREAEKWLKKTNFIHEQLLLMQKHPFMRRYSPDLLLLAYTLNNISPKAYQELRSHDILTLPSRDRLDNIVGVL